jgi:hypothetical protein
MLEAFIIDQLKKSEEPQWEPLQPTVELPLYIEDKPPQEEKKIRIIDLN